MIDVLGAYIRALRNGDNLLKLLISGQTLRNYAKSAADCLTLLTGRPCTYYDPATLSMKRVSLHPYLQEQISLRAAWTPPKPRKEPFTYLMLAVHATSVLQCAPDPYFSYLSLPYAVYDWLRLGVFTGSRLSEYAQSNLVAKQGFQTIPNNKDAGQWAGQPLAFIRADFEFFDQHHRLVQLSTLFTSHRKGFVSTVHIRFRFDKSAENFSIRKFSRTGDAILDPVDAAVSILHRADILRVPSSMPVGIYSKDSSAYTFLRDYHIKKVMRSMCVLAYPDPAHYLRIHLKRLVPHSNRVTAAVCLQMGGASNEEIAFRLRWKVESVPTYLRECFQEIGSIMLSTLQGAFKTS
jgi:hypothetical protein